MTTTIQQKLFKKGSTTYWTSALFFPKDVQEKVTRLYAFVRKADDFVDAIPQQKQEFLAFRRAYTQAYAKLTNKEHSWKSGDVVIDDFILLSQETGFNPSWTESFLDAMQSDTEKSTYNTIEETETYMYGSAEVIGLYLCKILDLPTQSYPAAQSLGKAMQYINFIRDIKEDIELHRQYIPVSEMEKAGLKSLTEAETQQKPDVFSSFIRKQIAYFTQWQQTAEAGYHFIPKRYRIAIKTAADIYKWTAKNIAKEPFLVYKGSLKPKKLFIIATALRNIITA